MAARHCHMPRSAFTSMLKPYAGGCWTEAPLLTLLTLADARRCHIVLDLEPSIPARCYCVEVLQLTLLILMAAHLCRILLSEGSFEPQSIC